VPEKQGAELMDWSVPSGAEGELRHSLADLTKLGEVSNPPHATLPLYNR